MHSGGSIGRRGRSEMSGQLEQIDEQQEVQGTAARGRHSCHVSGGLGGQKEGSPREREKER